MTTHGHEPPYPSALDARMDSAEARLDRIDREGLPMMIAQILGDIRELRADVRGWNTDSDRRITSLERRMSDSESDRKQIKEFLDQIRGGKVRSKDLGYWAMVTIAIVNGLIALTAIFGSPT